MYQPQRIGKYAFPIIRSSMSESVHLRYREITTICSTSYAFAHLLFGYSDRNCLKDYSHHWRHSYTFRHKDTQSAPQTEANRSHLHHSSAKGATIYTDNIKISIYTYIKKNHRIHTQAPWLSQFVSRIEQESCASNSRARLLPFTLIPVRSESRSKAPKSLLTDLTTRTPVPAYTNTLLEL